MITGTLSFKSTEMEGWLKLSLLLCVFGFLRELRVSEPYVTHFLVGPWKNFTKTEVIIIICNVLKTDCFPL
jgi:Reduced folate carrier